MNTSLRECRRRRILKRRQPKKMPLRRSSGLYGKPRKATNPILTRSTFRGIWRSLLESSKIWQISMT